jgi:hypothetical protein
LQFGSVGTDGRTVTLQKLATLSLSADAALPQCCVAQHVPDRHPGRLQTAEKLDPRQDRCVVIPMARLVAVSIGQQPDPLIVTNRICCQSRAFRQFTNLHEHPSRSTTQRKLGVRARSKSRGNRITVIRPPARCLRQGWCIAAILNRQMDKQGLFAARRSEPARRLLRLKPIHFRQGAGRGPIMPIRETAAHHLSSGMHISAA